MERQGRLLVAMHSAGQSPSRRLMGIELLQFISGGLEQAIIGQFFQGRRDGDG